jgi:hypothetical protein
VNGGGDAWRATAFSVGRSSNTPSAAYSSRSSVALSTSTRTGPSMSWPVVVSTANCEAAAAVGPVSDTERPVRPATTSSTVMIQANHRLVRDMGAPQRLCTVLLPSPPLVCSVKGSTKHRAGVEAIGQAGALLARHALPREFLRVSSPIAPR